MKYGYKVWHSEEHKTGARRQGSRMLDDYETSLGHENLEALVALNYELEPEVKANVVLLHPPSRGVIVVLHGELSETQADSSMARCLQRINALDVDLCFIAEPLPSKVSQPS